MSPALTFVYIELGFRYNLTVKIQKCLEQGTEVTGVMAVQTLSGFCMEDGWNRQSREEAAEDLRGGLLAVRTRHQTLSSSVRCGSVFLRQGLLPMETCLKLEMLLILPSPYILGSWVCAAPSLCREFPGKAKSAKTVASRDVFQPGC